MKIALAQTNPVIGDFHNNSNTIFRYIKHATDTGCRLIIFPEFALSGFPPQELLQRPVFLATQQKTLSFLLDEIIKNGISIDIILGVFEKNNKEKEESFFSSAIVIQKGKTSFLCRRKLFHHEDADSGHQYIDSEKSECLYNIDGDIYGIILGENGWNNEMVSTGRTLPPSRDPIATIFTNAEKDGVSLSGLINIAATPFYIDKKTSKSQLIQLSKRINLPLFYCNQAGGQNSLIFSGGSLVTDRQGQILVHGNHFNEDLIFFDSAVFAASANDSHDKGDDDSLGLLYGALVVGLRDYIHKSGFSKAVLGLSGGIDSALTVTLAVDALGADNILGVALPSPYTSRESIEDAEQLAQNLGCRFEIVPIGELFAHFNNTLHPFFSEYKEDVTEQNLQARIRGNLLMAFANKFNSMLLNTSNKSESAVGYGTLYGDMCGGLAVIGDLPKGLVYSLAEYLNKDRERIPYRIITKPPSAELKPGQKDQDELPPYDILDQIIAFYLNGDSLEDIVNRGFSYDVVEDVLRRIRINEYKRRQAPLTLKVSVNSFIDRYYPIVHNFRR